MVGLALATLLIRGALTLRSSRKLVTRANFDEIRLGMSRVQVEEILGPPGNYSTGPVRLYDWDGSISGNVGFDRYILYHADPLRWTDNKPQTPECSAWLGDDGEIVIEFGPGGVTMTVFVLPVHDEYFRVVHDYGPNSFKPDRVIGP